MAWKWTKTPCSPWALTKAQLGICISIWGCQLPGCQCLQHIFWASTEIQAMTILHNLVEKNVGFRYNFMSVGREHEYKTNANVYYPEVSGGRKAKSLSSLGTISLCIWGQICIPCKMCLISFLKVRSKELISLPIWIFHLIPAITFYQWQKRKKVKKKRFSSASVGFHCFIHLLAIIILPREESFNSPGMSF